MTRFKPDFPIAWGDDVECEINGEKILGRVLFENCGLYQLETEQGKILVKPSQCRLIKQNFQGAEIQEEWIENLKKEVKKGRCFVCSSPEVDACHIKTVGAHGDSSYHSVNLIPLCRWHHSQQHSMGWTKMLTMFPQLEKRLRDMGWYIEAGKMKHDIFN